MHAEIFTLITMLASDLPAVRKLSLAHRTFRLSGQQLLKVRVRFRQLRTDIRHGFTRHYTALPSGLRDGPVTLIDTDVDCIWYCISGALHGVSIDWYKSGQKEARYQYIGGQESGEQLEWYESGQLRKRFECVDGHYCNVQHYNIDGTILVDCRCAECCDTH